jgi:hypothetical protein
MSDLCPAVTEACALLVLREAVGRAEYGVTLTDAGLTPAQLVRHAQEEAADLTVYLTALLRMLEGRS